MLPEALKDYPVAAAIEAFDSAAITGGHAERGELSLDIDPGRILPVCRFLREQEAFIRLSSVTATDWHPAEPRFRVVYHLHSLERNLRVRLKCAVSGDNALSLMAATLCTVFSMLAIRLVAGHCSGA